VHILVPERQDLSDGEVLAEYSLLICKMRHWNSLLYRS